MEFSGCYARRTVAVMDGLTVPLISLADLRANKLASGRLKDLADLENLPTETKPAGAGPPPKAARRRGRR